MPHCLPNKVNNVTMCSIHSGLKKIDDSQGIVVDKNLGLGNSQVQ